MIRTRGVGSDVSKMVATIIVMEFKQDLREMGIVTNSVLLEGVAQDGSLVDTTTSQPYIVRVFRHKLLPAEMCCKSFLRMATDLLGEEPVKDALVQALLGQVKAVPKTTTHTGLLYFSITQYTLVLSGNLANLSPEDGHRLTLASKPIIQTKFGALISKRAVKQLVANRPTLTQTLRNMVHAVR